MNVLIVDDQEENRYLLKSLFTGSGHQVGEASNGKIALEMLEAGDYDLVISDILMPVMDGYRLCREIRSRERLKKRPFVFLTATYVDSKDEAFALKLGADRFFRKPFDPKNFISEIEKFMEDIEKNKPERSAEIPADDKEFLTLYNERLIHKLETKMASLEKEVAERKLAEKKLQGMLREKESLLREIHHRVKNNMQIISSMINLSSRSLRDPSFLEMLRQIKLRIRSMSMIQDKLFKSENLARIDFTEFLRDMTIHYFQYFKADANRIDMKMEAGNVWLPLEMAVPCGLIAGELVANSLKHAFPGDRKGEIVVDLRRLPNDEVVLSVRDNGVGIPVDLDILRAETPGFIIMNTLLGQIEGRLEVVRDKGLEFRVNFRAPLA